MGHSILLSYMLGSVLLLGLRPPITRWESESLYTFAVVLSSAGGRKAVQCMLFRVEQLHTLCSSNCTGYVGFNLNLT